MEIIQPINAWHIFWLQFYRWISCITSRELNISWLQWRSTLSWRWTSTFSLEKTQQKLPFSGSQLWKLFQSPHHIILRSTPHLEIAQGNVLGTVTSLHGSHQQMQFNRHVNTNRLDMESRQPKTNKLIYFQSLWHHNDNLQQRGRCLKIGKTSKRWYIYVHKVCSTFLR